MLCPVTSNKQEYFADYLAHYPSLFSLTQAALADGGAGPSNVRRRTHRTQLTPATTVSPAPR